MERKVSEKNITSYGTKKVWILPISGAKLSLLQLIGEEGIYRWWKGYSILPLSLGIDLFGPLSYTSVQLAHEGPLALGGD